MSWVVEGRMVGVIVLENGQFKSNNNNHNHKLFNKIGPRITIPHHKGIVVHPVLILIPGEVVPNPEKYLSHPHPRMIG